MNFFELEPADISDLDDADLREMVARLCEAELILQEIPPSCVLWGGAQEAPDGGLDIRVDVPTKLTSPGFVPRGNTGFQIKKNSMSKAACKQEMLEESCLKPVIENLASQKGAYIIVSGRDDCSDKMLSERRQGMNEAVEELSNKDDLKLDFYGRDRLATWLRQHPSVALWVRSRLGKPLSGWTPFGRWAATPPDQDDEFLLDDHPCVIDINSKEKLPMAISAGIRLVREKLRSAGSTVRLIGLSGVGKTRFAQALFEPKVGEDALPSSNVIYADLGDDILPTATELVTYLIANDLSTCIVLDNCPPDVHRKLQKKISSVNSCLSLLTIEYDISDDRPEETEVIHLVPISVETVSKLVQKRFLALGRINADKVAEFSGGNARVAIALASRVDADESLTNFSDDDLFHRLFHQSKDYSDGLLKSAEIMSLFYSFNVSQSEYNDELGVLASISRLERHILYRDKAELKRRQLSQQRGNWQAVLPHALANRLARRALQNIAHNEINNELFKSENIRLFKSCAHRLGYLHDVEQAQQLAKTWFQSGCPLFDITTCNDDLLIIFQYIAPVIPDIVLKSIEVASNNPKFISRDNWNIQEFVQLLCQLAYEDDYFDRATEVILKFAETEKAYESSNNVVGHLSSLFSIYLSGTQATSKRRQEFLKRLLNSDNPRHQEIAEKLLQSAFETSYWTSLSDFNFGARKRDFGWKPKNDIESLDWYTGFIDLIKPILISNDEVSKNRVKVLLANHFQGLWHFIRCFDILEEIVKEHASGGSWPEMWISIKRTIYYHGEKYSTENRSRLEALERIAAPTDLYSKIEAYVLTKNWVLTEANNGNKAEKTKNNHQTIIELGKLAASDRECLKKLAPKLWGNQIETPMQIAQFGEGLAKGSTDSLALFDFLVGLMQTQDMDQVKPMLFNGFILAIHSKNPTIARKLLERVLEIPELKPHFVELLGVTQLDNWGIEILIEMASNGEIDACKFERLKYGDMHESIQDKDLSKILSALNYLEGGVFVTIEILTMRFCNFKNSNYIPSESLQSVGREAIHKMLLMKREYIERYQHHLYELNLVAINCLSMSAPENEIREIVELLCEGIKSYRLYSFKLTEIIGVLIANFPELVLNMILSGDENEAELLHIITKNHIIPHDSLLNLAPVDRLVKWCNGNQDRIMKVAGAVSYYTSTDKENDPMNYPKQVKLSIHIKALLEIAEKPIDIVEMIYNGTFPDGCSESIADILESRSKAFAELIEHPSHDVREFVKQKLTLFEEKVCDYRDQESNQNRRSEQQFE